LDDLQRRLHHLFDGPDLALTAVARSPAADRKPASLASRIHHREVALAAKRTFHKTAALQLPSTLAVILADRRITWQTHAHGRGKRHPVKCSAQACERHRGRPISAASRLVALLAAIG